MDLFTCCQLSALPDTPPDKFSVHVLLWLEQEQLVSCMANKAAAPTTMYQPIGAMVPCKVEYKRWLIPTHLLVDETRLYRKPYSSMSIDMSPLSIPGLRLGQLLTADCHCKQSKLK